MGCKEIGQMFGRLTVLEEVASDLWGNPKVKVQCSCGSPVKVVNLKNLRSGASKSCGCYNREQLAARRLHNGEGTPEYGVWKSMWQRCTNKNNSDYANYRDRTPPERWRDFVNFLSDMGPRPSLKHSIERTDNSKPYGPENCKWATIEEQVRNRSNNRRITYKNKTLLLVDWAKELGLTHSALSHRLDTYGWSVEDALTTPSGARRKNQTLL